MSLNELCLSLILIQLVSPSMSRGWRGIEPLHSTRTDAERLLGSPVQSCDETCSYNTANENLTIVYSTHPCGTGDHNRWRVPVGTVVSVIVFPHVKPTLKDLKLNLKKLSKTRDPELSGYWIYTNELDGISYEVSKTSQVLSMEWFPGRKDNSLSCVE